MVFCFKGGHASESKSKREKKGLIDLKNTVLLIEKGFAITCLNRHPTVSVKSILLKIYRGSHVYQ